MDIMSKNMQQVMNDVVGKNTEYKEIDKNFIGGGEMVLLDCYADKIGRFGRISIRAFGNDDTDIEIRFWEFDNDNPPQKIGGKMNEHDHWIFVKFLGNGIYKVTDMDLVRGDEIVEYHSLVA